MAIDPRDLQELPESLPGWIREHLETYVGSGGTEGHVWRGVPTLLLKTRGRRSGRTRLTPLIYGRDGIDYVIVASKGGAPEHPAWYLNLSEEPEVEVQVGTEQFVARARTVDAADHERLWPELVAIWPAYENYRAATDPAIPIVALTPRR